MTNSIDFSKRSTPLTPGRPAIAGSALGSLRRIVGLAFTTVVLGEIIVASRALIMATSVLIFEFLLLISSRLKAVDHQLTPWRAPAT